MKILQVIQYCLEYHRTNSKKNAQRSTEFVLNQFNEKFGDWELSAITSDEVLAFLTDLTDGKNIPRNGPVTQFCRPFST